MTTAIRRRAEEVAEDPDALAALRADGALLYYEIEIRDADGSVIDAERAFDLIRDAVRSGNLQRAQQLAIAVHREIVDELAARPKLIDMEPAE